MAITLHHLLYQQTGNLNVAILQEPPQVFEEGVGQIRHDGQQELHKLLGHVPSSGPAKNFNKIATIVSVLAVALAVGREGVVAFFTSSTRRNCTHCVTLHITDKNVSIKRE